MAAPTLQVVLGSPLCSVATYGEVIMTAVHVELTREALDASVAANRKIASIYPQRVASLAMAHFGAKIPNAELRAAASQAMAATRQNTCCAAQVIAGEGFWHSTVRSVITAMEQLRPDDRPRRTFRTLNEAVSWLAAQLDRDTAWISGVIAAAQSLLETSHGPQTVSEDGGT